MNSNPLDNQHADKQESTALHAAVRDNVANLDAWFKANRGLGAALEGFENVVGQLLSEAPIIYRCDWISALVAGTVCMLNDPNDPEGERFLAMLFEAIADKAQQLRKALRLRQERAAQLEELMAEAAEQANKQANKQNPALH